MKILHAYILRGLLVNFFVGLSIFVAVLFMGNMMKIADLFIQGVPMMDIGILFLLLIPYFLSACIPMAFLTAILLVFGRLSQENEILAMKASGISIYQISYPIWILGIFLTMISFKIHNETIPYSHFKARKLVMEMGLKNPTAYLEPGNFVEAFPGYIIYIRERHEDILKKIMIYQTLSKGHVKTITAKEAKINYDAKEKVILLELKDGTVQEPTGKKFKDFFDIQFGNYTVKLDVKEMFRDPENLDKKHKDMTIKEIKMKIKKFSDEGINTSPLTTEINKKISVSFSCLAFALIGIPLGIRTHRSEKTVGVGISLLLVFFYYLFIIFGKALDENPQFHPEILMWVPNMVFIGLGTYMLRKIAR